VIIKKCGIGHVAGNVSKNLVMRRPGSDKWSPGDRTFGCIAHAMTVRENGIGHAVTPTDPNGHAVIDRVTDGCKGPAGCGRRSLKATTKGKSSPIAKTSPAKQAASRLVATGG